MSMKLFNSTNKLIQQRQRKTLQLAKYVSKDVNFHVNKCSYGYKTFQFHQITLMQQIQSKTLQQAKFVVKDVNLHVNKGSFGYKTLQLHKLSK